MSRVRKKRLQFAVILSVPEDMTSQKAREVLRDRLTVTDGPDMVMTSGGSWRYFQPEEVKPWSVR